MKPICVPCQRFFRIRKNGYYFIEAMPRAGLKDPMPGDLHPEQWEPYKLWAGDLWECEGCGAQIVSGVGQEPLVEHYMDEFQEKVRHTHADQLQVNDY